MKPEYLYSIATDLGLQFDGEARVMYGEREGFLLVIEGAQTKNVFTISLSVKQGSEGDLIEDSEILWNELKEQSKAINAISSDGYLTSIVVKGGMTKGKAVETLWTAIQDIVDFLLNHQFVQVNAETGEEGPIGLYQIGDAIFLIDDATFRAYQAEVQDTVEAYEAREENFPFRDCRRCDRCDHRWSSCPLSSASWLCVCFGRCSPRLLYHQRL